MSLSDYGPYCLALLAIWGILGLVKHLRRSRGGVALDAGDAVPDSLHPVINPALCIGCSACTNACPEGDIIAMVGGKAELVDAASCIGHGACKTACPTAAISLVFGSANRGVDIPQVAPDFQTNVPGLYIAGELGGMGLIANAIEQGSQAIEAISKRVDLQQANVLDVVIVGAGPAGFAASLAARERRLSVVTLEQGKLGGTVAHYPRAKLVMTRPAHLPMYGVMTSRRVRKEDLLGVWQTMLRKSGVQIRFGERVERVTPKAWGFEVTTQNTQLATRTVLLATGRRGAPRKLGVPGEDLPKVVYALADAEQHRGKRVLVVGGGNSALEAVRSLASQSDIDVTLSYRGVMFDRANQDLRHWLEAAEAQQQITVLRQSSVHAIEATQVQIQVDGQTQTLANDAVVVCVGGLLPIELLTQAGVAVETKFGTR